MWINAHIWNHRVEENPNFWHNVRLYVKGRANGLRLMESFRRQGAPDEALGVNKIVDDVKNNFYSLYILGMEDQYIATNADPRFWIDLYYIREYLGIETNFGNKNKYSLTTMTTESPEWTPEWLNRLFASIKTTAVSIADALKAVFEKVWTFFEGHLWICFRSCQSIISENNFMVSKAVWTYCHERTGRRHRFPSW